MKVLLVNGSPHPTGTTYAALSEVAAELERQGIEAQIYRLLQARSNRVQLVADAIKKDAAGCVFDDGVNEFIDEAKKRTDSFRLPGPLRVGLRPDHNVS